MPCPPKRPSYLCAARDFAPLFLLLAVLGGVFWLGRSTVPEEGPAVFVPGEVVNPTAFYPEGPQLLENGTLLVAEMPKDRVVAISLQGVKTVWEEKGCGPTSVKKLPEGGFWVLCHLGHKVVRLSPTFKKTAQIEKTQAGRRVEWPNDGSVDSKGNLYLSSAGLFSLRAPATGRLVRIDAQTNEAEDLAQGIRYSNGVLVQEALKRVLVSEHLNRRVLSFPLLDSGKVGPLQVFFDFRKKAPVVEAPYIQSGPDGIAAFENGDLCIADYGNGRILVVSSDGQYRHTLRLPQRFVTNMAIAKDQKSLYVVMTRDNASKEKDGIVQRFLVKE